MVDDWKKEDNKIMDLNFKNIDSDAYTSVMMYYMNSGYSRFFQYKEYDNKLLGKEIDSREICKEIENEKLSDDELLETIQNFYNDHSFTDLNLVSCGACGIREYESRNIKYQKVMLKELPSEFRYNVTDEQKLQTVVDQGEVTGDYNGIPYTLKPWNGISYYVDYTSESFTKYHLHPELVTQSPKKETYTMFCPICYKALQKGIPSKFSIAKGGDFGKFHRIAGLDKLNLHEELILSTVRLFQVAIKVMPNGGSQQKNFTRNSIKGNAILFAQDAPTVVDKLAHPEYLNSLLRIYLVDEDGNIDKLAEKSYKTTTLFARTHVLFKWLKVLQKLNKYYDVSDDDIKELLKNTSESILKQKKSICYNRS